MNFRTHFGVIQEQVERVAEDSSLIKILQEAEQRGFVSFNISETPYSYNSPYTTGHLRCFKPGGELPAIVVGEFTDQDKTVLIFRLYAPKELQNNQPTES